MSRESVSMFKQQKQCKLRKHLRVQDTRTGADLQLTFTWRENISTNQRYTTAHARQKKNTVRLWGYIGFLCHVTKCDKGGLVEAWTFNWEPHEWASTAWRVCASCYWTKWRYCVGLPHKGDDDRVSDPSIGLHNSEIKFLKMNFPYHKCIAFFFFFFSRMRNVCAYVCFHIE